MWGFKAFVLLSYTPYMIWWCCKKRKEIELVFDLISLQFGKEKYLTHVKGKLMGQPDVIGFDPTCLTHKWVSTNY